MSTMFLVASGMASARSSDRGAACTAVVKKKLIYYLHHSFSAVKMHSFTLQHCKFFRDE
jgi:hypothetical protein